MSRSGLLFIESMSINGGMHFTTKRKRHVKIIEFELENDWFAYRLLRRQAPSPSASFFERMQFLIQEDGLQTSSIYSSFNERYCDVFLYSYSIVDFWSKNSFRASAFNKRWLFLLFVISFRTFVFPKQIKHLNKIQILIFSSTIYNLDVHPSFVVKFSIKILFH